MKFDKVFKKSTDLVSGKNPSEQPWIKNIKFTIVYYVVKVIIVYVCFCFINLILEYTSSVLYLNYVT